ncbi:MAG: PHP domain-containing protein [Thermoanaerobacteraceae bacterium]
MIADLHMHSTSSDGSNSPSEVVRLAKEHNLDCISLTDHDTINGLCEALEASKKYNIELIPGIELNSFNEEQEVHILGYFLNYKDKNLLVKLNNIIDLRLKRAEEILKKLNNIGIQINLEDILEFTNKNYIGRPHIARALIKKKYVTTVKEAFEKYIGEDAPAYVKSYRLNTYEAIELLKNNGAVPVLAHPGLLKNDKIIKDLVNHGLMGIEVYHSKHTQDDINYYLEIAKSFNLLITGGSDFHGIEVDGRDLLGSIKLDYSYVKLLKAKAKNFVEIC